MHAIAGSAGRRSIARLGGLTAGVLVALGAPAIVAAHNLGTVYQSPLPLAVYLAGAATTVALSFVFVLARDMRAAPTPPGRVVHVPAALRTVLRVVGLIGWAWIVAQGIAGGTSEASVATLFLWVYGWVGVAMLSALLAPVWEWVNPFATIYDLLAWALRTHRDPRLGHHRAAGRGPGVAGGARADVLHLARARRDRRQRDADRRARRVHGADARPDGAVRARPVARRGRDVHGLVPDAQPACDLRHRAGGDRRPRPAASWRTTRIPTRSTRSAVLRRPFASGLLDATWEIPRVALVALATASIIFDGLSQTVAFATVFGNPALVQKTVLLIVFLWVIAGTALVVGRAVSWGAIGAGLTPIAVGYLDRRTT